MSSNTFTEARRTLALAFPIAIGQVSQMAMGITDTVMIGRAGKVPLAAAAFANSLFLVVFIASIGVLMSVSILAARAHGARHSGLCADYLRHGMWIGLSIGVGGAMLLLLAGQWLGDFGQPPEVVAEIQPYYTLLVVSLIPTLFFQVLRQYSEAVGHPWTPMAILMGGVLLNVFLNWVLIYGHWGAPALGLAGAGWATLAARCVAAVGLWAWLSHRREIRAEWPGASGPGWTAPISGKRIKELLGIGVPAAGQLLFESGAFSASAIMMGWIGTTALAAHQIALNCASCTFMVPLGLSIATSVRIGRAVGSGQGGLARRIGFGSIGAGALFAVCASVLFATAGPWIVRGFSTDPGVLTLATRLLLVAALFQLVDGGQAIVSGALRGLADVKMPTAITFVAYWLVALPIGYFYGVRGVGPVGVWFGLTAGLALAYGLLIRRFHTQTSKLSMMRAGSRSRAEPLV